MSKHTPGPWKIQYGGFDTDDGFGIASDNVQARNVKNVAECWPCTIVSQDHRLELLANARLIAAAPELLEALKKCADYLDMAFELHDDPFDEEHNGAVDAIDAARAAIAKAEGTAQ